MKVLDLFSGIGGFALACQWVWGDDYEPVAFVEIDKYCQKVLHKHWPDVPIIEDIRNVKGNVFVTDTEGRESREPTESERRENTCGGNQKTSRIDLITGGFPCQPFSCAGKRKGKEDDRFLWPEMLRVIQEIKPRWVLGENVAGIIGMELENCISGLEMAGYEVETLVIPACTVQAPHRRDRVWIVAHTVNSSDRTEQRKIPEKDGIPKINREAMGSGMPSGADCHASDTGCLRPKEYEKQTAGIEQYSEDVTNTKGKRLPESGKARGQNQKENARRGGFADNNSWGKPWYEAATRLCRVDDGVPSRVDRLKCLGNAIVPQVAYQILKAIREIEK